MQVSTLVKQMKKASELLDFFLVFKDSFNKIRAASTCDPISVFPDRFVLVMIEMRDAEM
jgi:hypothetical protein